MTSLCTHGVQTGEGYECSSCVTSPTFAEQLDTHLQRLAAERTPSVALVEERTEEDVQSEVLRSALYDLTTLHNIVAAHVRESAGRAAAFEALDRIESAVRRGEQR